LLYKPYFEVVIQLGAYKLSNKLSRVGWGGGGWVGGWVLDQVKIRLTQPQVELELRLNLAKVGYTICLSRMTPETRSSSRGRGLTY
jgi:hypothetical protein